MGVPPELGAYQLCVFFLMGYLTAREDPENFPPNELPRIFQQYERVFKDALDALNLSHEALRARPEFNFDPGDPASLESGIAVLRVVNALQQKGYQRIALLGAEETTGADVVCYKDDQKICCEVKAITKQSEGRKGFYLENQVYEKVRENAVKARTQLKATAVKLNCQRTTFAVVMNWSPHDKILGDNDLRNIVDKLDRDLSLGERDGLPLGLGEIDDVLFVMPTVTLISRRGDARA